jgi:hypothetical protein
MDDAPLLRAMPRRPLYALSGLTTRIDLGILNAIQEDGWFATRDAIIADVDCKEVRLAVLVQRGREALADADGRIARLADIGPEQDGLAALKQLAKAVAAEATGGIAAGVELVGYLNDDAEPSLRHVFVLVYRARVVEGVAAPAGCSWLASTALPRGLDPVSSRIAALLG